MISRTHLRIVVPSVTPMHFSSTAVQPNELPPYPEYAYETSTSIACVYKLVEDSKPWLQSERNDCHPDTRKPGDRYCRRISLKCGSKSVQRDGLGPVDPFPKFAYTSITTTPALVVTSTLSVRSIVRLGLPIRKDIEAYHAVRETNVAMSSVRAAY